MTLAIPFVTLKETKGSMIQNIKRILGVRTAQRFSPEERARILFQKYAREQFLRLKEKGLGITIMTL